MQKIPNNRRHWDKISAALQFCPCCERYASQVSMRVFRYRREETLGAFNFGQYQIYVCKLSNTKGEISRGNTVLCSDSIIEYPFPLDETGALKLSNYLLSVSNGEVPQNFKVKGSLANIFTSIYFRFSKIKDGMLKGRISLGMFLGGRTSWVTVKPSSALACSQAINKLYSSGDA